MERTCKPMIAGICTIVAGALGVIMAIGILIGSGIIGSLMIGAVADIPRILPGILIAIAIPVMIIAIIAIVGGVYALKRKIWGLALAGAILSIFIASPLGLALGIAAIVLLILSKEEFS
ncbi:hypothetical protein ACFLYM_00250 [Chloroflexota bacterium]